MRSATRRVGGSGCPSSRVHPRVSCRHHVPPPRRGKRAWVNLAATASRTTHPTDTASRTTHPTGLTLFELLAVMGILLVLGTLVVPVVGSRIGQSRDEVTRQSLQRLREAIVGTYHDDMDGLPRPGEAAMAAGRADHPQLAYLFVNPETHLDGNSLTRDYDITFDPISRRGWRGPYLLHKGSGFPYTPDVGRGFSTRYGKAGDPAVLDGWGNPIVLQEPTDTNATAYDRSRHARLVSAGPSGVIDTDPNQLLPADRGDDVVLFLWIAEP